MSSTYKFSIKPLRGLMKVKHGEGFLEELRPEIEQCLKKFVFIEEENENQIKIDQGNVQLNPLKVYKIKFIEDQEARQQIKKQIKSQVKKQDQSQVKKQKDQEPRQGIKDKTKSATTQFKIVDDFLNFSTFVIIESDSYLDKVRSHIHIPNGYQSFGFLRDRIEISKSSQKNILVSTLISTPTKDQSKNQPTIKIKFHKTEQIFSHGQRQKKDQNNMKKAQQTRQKVNNMIKQLKDFQAQFAKQTKQKNKAKEQKFKQLSKRLDQMNIPFTLKSDTNINDIISNLKKKQEQKLRLVDTLWNASNQSINQLASKFTGQIGIGFHSAKVVKSNSIDFALSNFEVDNSLNMLDSTDYDYSSSSAQSKHMNRIQTSLNGGSISAMGGNPFFFLKVTAAMDSDSMSQSTQSQNKSFKDYFKNFISLYVGKGLRLVQDGIELKYSTISQYENIFKQSFNKGNQGDLAIMVNDFFSKYGDTLQIGVFYFGNTFKTTLQVSFEESQSLFSSKKIAQSALRIAIEGGGVSQSGFGAGKATFNQENTSANTQSKQQIQSKYSVSAHSSSYPPVQEYGQWKELVATNNNYWKIIGKNTQKVSILKLLRSNNTINRSPYLQTKTTRQIRDFQKKILGLYDPKTKTQQLSSKQFIEDNFYIISKAMQNVIYPSRIERIIVKRTSSVKSPI